MAKKIIAMGLAFLGMLASSAATTACLMYFLDEPEMSKEMIEK